MSSLADTMPVEQKRCRELLVAYRDIGPNGLFGAAVIEDALHRADLAMAGGDVVDILRSYEELKNLK